MTLVKTRDRACGFFNPWTGGCTQYETRIELCRIYKCRWLNILSRLTGEPEWDDTYPKDMAEKDGFIDKPEE